jgi:hypothetical protein
MSIINCFTKKNLGIDNKERGLGFKIQFTSVDISDLKKSTNYEASAVVSNCKVYIILDSTDVNPKEPSEKRQKVRWCY